MAYTQGTVSANEQSALAADAPVLLGDNRLEDKAASAIWVSWTAARPYAENTDASAADADYPTSRVHDRYQHLATQPAKVSTNQNYALIFQLDASGTADTVAILNHNFGSVTKSSTLSVFVDIADNGTFSSNRRRLVTLTNPTSQRLVQLNLGPNGTEYDSITGLVWVQVSVQSDAEITTLPSIGEIVIGRRRQISLKPELPWDDRHYSSDYADFKSKSGITTRYIRSKGRRLFAPTWRPTGTDSHSLNDITTLETWWKTDIDYGTKTFLYTEDPSTTPRNSWWCQTTDPDLSMPLSGPAERPVSLSFEEQAPFLSSEV